MEPERVYPSRLAASEHAWVKRRRGLAGVGPDGPEVGFALSGGGIRSATFCLGVFQALARLKLVRRIDWLSTVSGGGYFGGFLGALFLPDSERRRKRPRVRPDQKRRAGNVEETLTGTRPGAVDWLRQNGRYLSPAGAGDALFAMAVQLRNFLALHLIIGLGLVTIALAGLAARPVLAWAGVVGSATAVSGLPGAVGAGLPWSPWVSVTLVPILLVAVPTGWAYWLTARKRKGKRDVSQLVATVVVAGLCFVPDLLGVGLAVNRFVGWQISGPLRVLGGTAVLALATWCWFDWWPARSGTPDLEYFLLSRRNCLSRIMKTGLVVAAALLAFGVVDTLGQSLYETIALQGWRAVMSNPSIWSPLAAVLAVFGALRRFVGVLPTQTRLGVPWQAAAWVAAVVVATLLATAWAATAHAFVWAGWVPRLDVPWARALVGAVAGLGLSWAVGLPMQFVNNSSFHAIYAARLTRAYLGASNPMRFEKRQERVTDVIRGDAIPSAVYRPHAFGGPLHIVNLTLNETIGGRDQIEYRDRKGLGMALGPVGLSIGKRHHALWMLHADKQTRQQGLGPELQARRLSRAEGGGTGFHPLFKAGEDHHAVQSRQVGHWMAISGAAFTTGLGARTSLPLALLLGLANVRLGYWWDSQVTPGERDKEAAATATRWFMRRVEKVFRVQTSLFDECLARFWGPAKTYWYLSDGGHFENTGCYELLRRRVPLIVCCDCGADPTYAWEDFANLVRKARTDLSAEIRLPSRAELLPLRRAVRARDICEMDRIVAPRRQEAAKGAGGGGQATQWADGHAIVAYVNYLDDEQKRHDYATTPTPRPDSVLLILKPSLTGDEPADVLEYAQAHPTFPHESTLDQYFDEAQWESYRRLGQHVAEGLFREGDPWFPLQPWGTPSGP